MIFFILIHVCTLFGLQVLLSPCFASQFNQTVCDILSDTAGRSRYGRVPYGVILAAHKSNKGYNFIILLR